MKKGKYTVLFIAILAAVMLKYMFPALHSGVSRAVFNLLGVDDEIEVLIETMGSGIADVKLFAMWPVYGGCDANA